MNFLKSITNNEIVLQFGVWRFRLLRPYNFLVQLESWVVVSTFASLVWLVIGSPISSRFLRDDSPRPRPLSYSVKLSGWKTIACILLPSFVDGTRYQNRCCLSFGSQALEYQRWGHVFHRKISIGWSWEKCRITWINSLRVFKQNDCFWTKVWEHGGKSTN